MDWKAKHRAEYPDERPLRFACRAEARAHFCNLGFESEPNPHFDRCIVTRDGRAMLIVRRGFFDWVAVPGQDCEPWMGVEPCLPCEREA